MHIGSDGSFYLTIEETNEQRIKLGLKPLNVGGNNTTTSSKIIVDQQKEDEASEIQKRIELAKIKRKEREFKRKQGSINDSEDDEDIDGEVHKAKEKLKKEKKKTLAFEEEEEELRPNAKVYDLSSSKPTIASDFEVLKKKKVKNIRVKEKTSQIGGDATPSNDLLQLMEMNSSSSIISATDERHHHLAKREENRITKREQLNLINEREKDRTYQEAIDRAQEESMLLHNSTSSSSNSNAAVDDRMVVDTEEMMNTSSSGKLFDSTKHFVKTLAVENVKTETSSNDHSTPSINKRTRKSASAMRSKDAVDSFDDERRTAGIAEDESVAYNNNSSSSELATVVKEAIKQEEIDEKKEIFQDPENLVKEPLVSDGLLATIEFASLQGFLEDKRVGRSKDRSHVEERLKPVALGYDDETMDFVIEHLDQHGNLLTPKEAYREFSHKYHGNAPKKKKLAKERKRMDLEKRRNMGASDDSLKVLQHVMKESQQPFVELNKETFGKTLEVRSQLQKENKPNKKKQKKEEVKE